MTKCDECHENREPLNDFHYGPFEMSLERDYRCKQCGHEWIEVWIHSTDIDLPE